MEKEQGIILPIIIVVIVVAVILFGGVFAYKFYQPRSLWVPETNNETANKKCPGSFVKPNGDSIKQGEKYTIGWIMPDGYVYYSMDLLLIDNGNNIVGKVYPGNWIKYNETSSWIWDGQNVDPYTGKFDVLGGINKPKIQVKPGAYKLRLVYKYVDSKNCQEGQFESGKFQVIK